MNSTVRGVCRTLFYAMVGWVCLLGTAGFAFQALTEAGRNTTPLWLSLPGAGLSLLAAAWAQIRANSSQTHWIDKIPNAKENDDA